MTEKGRCSFMKRICKREKRLMGTLLVWSLAVGMMQGNMVSMARKATLAKKNITVEVGKSKKIEVRYKNKGKKYLFTSSKTKIAKVDKTGKVIGVKAGTTKISVKEQTKSAGKVKVRKLGVVTVTVKSKKANSENKPTVVPTATPTVTAEPTEVPTAIPTATAEPTAEPTKVPNVIPTLAPTGDEYNKEIFRVAIQDTKLETVNGNTCKVDMQFFSGETEGNFFNGKVYKESSYVTKAYKDGRKEGCGRFILNGKDDTGKACKIFVQGQTKVDAQGKEEFVRPVILTNSKSLAWMETADIKLIMSSDKVLHFMWNESNKEPVAPPAVVMPDTSREYTREIFRFFIDIGASDEVKGNTGNVSMIHFGGRGDFDTFKGNIVADSTDTQMKLGRQTQTLSARYILEGTDAKGNPCRVYVENNGINTGVMTTEPIIITDCPDYAWIESAPLHGTVSWESGLTIHMWTTADGK